MKQFAKLLLILIAISIQIIGCKKADNSSSDNNGGGAGSEDVRVTTYTPQNITSNSAVCGGDAIVVQGLSLTEIGVCWNTTENPVASENHLSTEVWNEPFVCTITGLEPETQYYVRAYALRGLEYYYGDEKSFTTLSNQLTIPLITTYDVTDVTGISAVCGGIVMSEVISTIIAKGVCWNTSENPTIDNQHTDNGPGTGEFTATLSGLQPNTTYYIRVYATNESGTYYGLQKSFITGQILDEIYYNDDNPIHLALREEHKIADSSAYPITYTSSDNMYVTVSDDGVLTGKNVGNAQVTLDNGFHSLTIDVIVDLFREPTFEFGCSTNRIRELYGTPLCSGYVNDTILVYQYTGTTGYSYACGEMDFFFNNGSYFEADLYIRPSVEFLLSRYLDENFTFETILNDTISLYRNKIDNSVMCGKFDSYNPWNEICLYYYKDDNMKKPDAILKRRKCYRIKNN